MLRHIGRGSGSAGGAGSPGAAAVGTVADIAVFPSGEGGVGALGAWIRAAAASSGLALPRGDAIAPGIAFAQAIGRWGNWFNQELYGKETTLPWALKIDGDADAGRVAGTYQPTPVRVAVVRRRGSPGDLGGPPLQLGHGRAFALYVASYTVGRSGSSTSGWTTPTMCSGCGSTTGRPSWSSWPRWPIW
ncbi:Phosphatidylglycerol--prolipoprotein diacylglyceryl transferase [Streptomyces antimycoticus]